jgi:hypothetical protein
MGAVEVSPLGGLRHRSVFGPALSSKYSMHWGRVNVGGRFKVVKDEPSGGILRYDYLSFGEWMWWFHDLAALLFSCFFLSGS